MIESRFDDEAQAVCAAFPHGPRLAVIGSTSFWGSDSRELCEAIAADLAARAELVALTGGMGGVGLTFGRAFAGARRAGGLSENLFHLLPRGFGPCDSGITVSAGADYFERREVLGRVGQVYLVVEGGPGTQHEAAVAAGRGVPVIPLARTGGHADELYHRLSCPQGVQPNDWEVLADAAAPSQEVVAAVGRLVAHSLAT